MAGKIEIPEELKKDLPQSKWGKTLGATPIIMTVIATMLAGLASSEMTKAQYDRSFAAQLQSKAGDQWSYYQAKKLRSSVARNSLDLLHATTDVKPLAADVLENADAATVAALVKNQIPTATPAKFEAEIVTAMEAVESGKPEEEVRALLAKIKHNQLDSALLAAKDSANDFDHATRAINKASDKFDDKLMPGSREIFASFSSARLRYSATRYEMEARLNQSVAGIYELQVRKWNVFAVAKTFSSACWPHRWRSSSPRSLSRPGRKTSSGRSPPRRASPPCHSRSTFIFSFERGT
jgi:hypothetical protein